MISAPCKVSPLKYFKHSQAPYTDSPIVPFSTAPASSLNHFQPPLQWAFIAWLAYNSLPILGDSCFFTNPTIPVVWEWTYDLPGPITVASSLWPSNWPGMGKWAHKANHEPSLRFFFPPGAGEDADSPPWHCWFRAACRHGCDFVGTTGLREWVQYAERIRDICCYGLNVCVPHPKFICSSPNLLCDSI